MATSKFQGGFKRHHRTHHWAGVLNDILVDIELGRKPVFVASVDCAKAFDAVSFSALLEPLSNSPCHTLVQNLTVNHQLRVHSANMWLYPPRKVY